MPYTLNYLIYVIMMLIYKWYNYLNILVARIFTPRKLLSVISLFNIAAKSKEKKSVLFVAIEMSTLVHKEFLKSRVIKSTNDIYLTKKKEKIDKCVFYSLNVIRIKSAIDIHHSIFKRQHKRFP